MIDKPSVFDGQDWLQIPPVQEKSGSIDPVRRFHVMTQLPRLTSLVRAVREDPTNSVAATKAVKLAEKLLNLDWKVSHDPSSKHINHLGGETRQSLLTCELLSDR